MDTIFFLNYFIICMIVDPLGKVKALAYRLLWKLTIIMDKASISKF